MTDFGDSSGKLAATIADLLERYGSDAVKAEVQRQTKRRTGPRSKPDWSLLHPQLQADARKLLSGELHSRPTNRKIARLFAEQHPKPMPESVQRRIQRKLATSRDLYMLYNAFLISETESPWWLHLRITEILSEVDPKLRPVWQRTLEQQQMLLAHARKLRGKPDDSETFASILASMKNAQTKGGMSPG